MKQVYRQMIKLERQKPASDARKKELDSTRQSLEKMLQEMATLVVEEYLPYQASPLDETSEQARQRKTRQKAAWAEILRVRLQMEELSEITRPYEPERMAGSVWLYLRRDVQARK